MMKDLVLFSIQINLIIYYLIPQVLTKVYNRESKRTGRIWASSQLKQRMETQPSINHDAQAKLPREDWEIVNKPKGKGEREIK